MDLNPQAWPELLLEFGPYAILALFVLWVLPRSSKRMQQMTNTAPRPVQVAATVAVGISWAVVLLMVAYVLIKWSPMRVYEGKLGILNQSEQIYPLDDNVYVKAAGVEAPGRQRWQFALVDTERKIKKDGEANFTYCWGSGPRDCTDYIIPVGDIVTAQSPVFRFTRKDPEKAYKWVNGQWELAWGRPDARPRHAVHMGWDAYAGPSRVDLSKLAAKLASVNRVLRAEGRKELRSLTDAQLSALRAMTSNAEALHQIDLEQERRKR